MSMLGNSRRLKGFGGFLRNADLRPASSLASEGQSVSPATEEAPHPASPEKLVLDALLFDGPKSVSQIDAEIESLDEKQVIDALNVLARRNAIADTKPSHDGARCFEVTEIGRVAARYLDIAG